MYKFLDLIEEMLISLGTIFNQSWELCNLVAHRMLGSVSKVFPLFILRLQNAVQL